MWVRFLPGTPMEITKDNLTQILKVVARRDTSANPEGWAEESPLWGHCAVAALVAQDYFGGKLMRGSLEQVSKYSHARSHYWNRLPSGNEIDFTAGQYPDITFRELYAEERSREHVLSHPDTVRRYKLLSKRVKKYIGAR